MITRSALLHGSVLAIILSTADGSASPATDPTIAWNKTYRDTFDSYANGVSVNSAGDVFVVGSSEDIYNDVAYRLLKYASDGTVIWSKAYSGLPSSSPAYGRSVLATSSGAVYLVGRWWSAGTSNYRFRTVKVDGSTGLEAWGWDYPHTETAYGVAVDAGGNAYVVGDDFRTIKYDAGGNVLWSRTFGDQFSCTGRAVVCDGTSRIFLAGRELNYGVVIAADLAGNRIWTSPVSMTFVHGIALDSSGRLVVVGRHDGSDPTSMRVAVLDSAGNLVWERSWSSGVKSAARGVAVDAEGGIYVTGVSDSDCPSIVSPDSDYCDYPGTGGDFRTLKYDRDGNLIWNVSFNGGYQDSAFGVAVGDGGAVYVTGRSWDGARWLFRTIKYQQSGVLPLAVDLAAGSMLVANNVIDRRGQSGRAAIHVKGDKDCALQVRILNAAGALVRTLELTTVADGGGAVAFDGMDANGTPLAVGVYRVIVDGCGVRARKALVVKP